MNKKKQDNGTFLRFAFMNMLLDIVYRSRDPRIILDGLKIVCQDNLAEDVDQIIGELYESFDRKRALV